VSKPDESAYLMLRVPRELGEQLRAEADELLRIYQEGKGDLPREYCEKVPLHYVIKPALEDMRSKRVRSRAPRREASIDRVSPDVASGGGDVYSHCIAAEGGG
jgi:hypothetical protein